MSLFRLDNCLRVVWTSLMLCFFGIGISVKMHYTLLVLEVDDVKFLSCVNEWDAIWYSRKDSLLLYIFFCLHEFLVVKFLVSEMPLVIQWSFLLLVLTYLAVVCDFLQQELMRNQISKKHAGGFSLLVVFLVGLFGILVGYIFKWTQGHPSDWD